jgi:hypothetical protein
LPVGVDVDELGIGLGNQLAGQTNVFAQVQLDLLLNK